jgi:cytidylate kinase
MQIIGISGTNGSGKDTVMRMLAEKYGFYEASATLMLEEELLKRGLPLERENKRNLSAEWRREAGLGVIVDKAVEAAQAAGYDKVVVGSLRNSGEVTRVHELGGEVVWTDADPAVRYERIQRNDRGRVEDKKTFEQFLAEQAAEMQPSGDATTLDMANVRAKADRTITNDADSIQDFLNEVELVLKDLL